jgi:hypothetical protein
MRFENVEEEMTFGAAAFDACESVNCGVVARMTHTFSVESNGANLEHL